MKESERGLQGAGALEDRVGPLRIDDDFITEWQARYEETEHDQPEYERLVSAVADEVSRLGTLSRQTFTKILDWKAARVKGRIEWERFEQYTKTFARALNAPEDSKLSILCELPWIGAPVASTFLHFIYPNEFPIIDYRTVEVLHYAGYIESKSRDIHRYPTFRSVILGIYHALGERWSLRQIDRALFAYHKQFLEPAMKKEQKKQTRLQMSPSVPEDSDSEGRVRRQIGHKWPRLESLYAVLSSRVAERLPHLRDELYSGGKDRVWIRFRNPMAQGRDFSRFSLEPQTRQDRILIWAAPNAELARLLDPLRRRGLECKEKPSYIGFYLTRDDQVDHAVIDWLEAAQ